ncbi:MAG: C/D box methylation guide ribonucleoprotein complex aNOP56 subunit [Ignisphaera sp.]|nr:C/D box methylation guide ribonucleoprotein complex aNOP56 subunit [Ignisphaera sp.]MCX8168050.1 C/D box methylation guide ribonucleoprotein complex aNOP56 subunit [Ignisphaera sp.]MDW8085761.1 C/D box methylation guide ribonucleoprotein complex aNOP56 subunit [Ignisphaera sp.]
MSGRIFIADTALGVFALNEAGEIVEKVLYPRDVGRIVEELIPLAEGRASSSLLQLVEALKAKVDVGRVTLVFEDPDIAREFAQRGFSTDIAIAGEPVYRLRRELPELAVRLGLFKDAQEFLEYMHSVSLEFTRRKLRRYAQKRDLLAVQAIRAIDDIDKTLNLLATRLREWYSVHFPELDDLSKEHDEYVKIVANIGFREAMDVDTLSKLGISEGRAKRVFDTARKSIGADLSEMDMSIIRTVANIWLELYELREKLTGYITHVMKEVAPNITALVGPLLGARLLSLAGSLEELAKLPASTVQVLGAEKALFRALRTGGRPPKHGVIFQFSDIRKAPRWQRGKISRALATKLSIAARIDFFTGRYVGDELRGKLMERIEEVKQLYPKPPKREAREPKPTRREGKREKR